MSVFNFLYHQFFTQLPYPSHDFSGQTVIVTGSNAGLGLEAARHFTRLNAEKVILAVRNLEKGEAAKTSIEESTKRTGVVDVWQLDLTSYESVKDFAAKAQTLQRLDVMVENAGIAPKAFSIAENNESTITVNVISTFLLSLMVLPKLRETAIKFNVTPTLVIVSSEVHFWSKFSQWKAPSILDTTADEKKSDMTDRYNLSKLLEVFFVRHVAGLLKASSKPFVTMNYLNPGLCHSELGRDLGFGFRIFKFFLARTTEVGSRSLVHAAQAGEASHGAYLTNCDVSEPSAFVRSDDGKEAQQKFSKELLSKLESIQPGIASNI